MYVCKLVCMYVCVVHVCTPVYTYMSCVHSLYEYMRVSRGVLYQLLSTLNGVLVACLVFTTHQEIRNTIR